MIEIFEIFTNIFLGVLGGVIQMNCTEFLSDYFEGGFLLDIKQALGHTEKCFYQSRTNHRD